MNWIQDAGHGGTDPGAVSQGNTEKIYTLEAALYVDKRLADHGILSDVTRSSDITLGPNQRTSMVKKYKKSISHHYNAGGGSGAEFIHSTYSDGAFERILLEEFKNAGYPVRPNSVYSRRNSSSGDYYYMHRETGSARVTILEYEFVDGPQAAKIKDKTYREGMYECVVRAICRDEGITYKPLTQTTQPSPITVEIVNNSEYVGKTLTVKTDGLWFYNTPRWDIKDGVSNAGDSFIITEELLVNGVRMVKNHDGKYRTADPKYVTVSPAPSDWPYTVQVENITHQEAKEIVNLIQARYKNATVYGRKL